MHGFRMPDQITIYQRPHERMSRDRAELEKMVEDTVWHEIAHYFGMDEARVRRAEFDRERRVRTRRRERLSGGGPRQPPGDVIKR
jgi:hypothetical protein